MPEINKSTRHSKITGNFSENLVLYILSKHGFECANVDHTGIDIIARNPKTKELMGISVKSRSRNIGKEGQYVSIPNENIEKVDNACLAFGCKPYFAIVVDEDNFIKIYILSKDHLLELFPMKEVDFIDMLFTGISDKQIETTFKTLEKMEENINE